VYLDRQFDCGKRCRVKILTSQKKQQAQSFLRDAKRAAAMFHPNVVDVYETGTLGDGRLFVISENPDRNSLRDLLDETGIPPLLTTMEIAEQMAWAVHAIHEEGLLHLALRPENIFLDTDEHGQMLVRVGGIDFGGVVERSIMSNKFLVDTELDSLRYFAPEQCSGDQTSVQTDVYTLGIILYEMLSGGPPFDAPKASGLIEKHRHQRPPDVHIDNFDLRMLLTHTLSESLQKDAVLRQSSAQAFARQLRHMEQLATHVSTPPPAMTVSSAPKVTAATSAIEHDSEIHLESIPEMIETEIAFVVADELPADHLQQKSRLDRVSRMARERLRRSRVDKVEMPNEGSSSPANSDSIPAATDVFDPVPTPAAEVDRFELPKFVDADPDEITAVTARPRPLVIEWEQPDDDIPSIDAVVEELSKENVLPSFDVDRLPENAPAPERRRKDRPATRRDEVQSYPYVMRKSDEFDSPNLSYPLLSGYGAANAHFSFDYHTLLLGGAGLAAAVLLFFFAHGSFTRLFQSSSPVAESPITTAFESTVPNKAVEPALDRRSPKTVQKRKTDDIADTVSVSSPALESQPKAQPVVDTSSPDRVRRDKTPRSSTTLAESTVNTKSRSTVEKGKRVTAQRPPIATNKVTGTTRPRVVRNPAP
jgi:serine/threonine-protein kinase